MTTDSAANSPDRAEHQTPQQAERGQTDQSLRLEREKVDDALSEHLRRFRKQPTR